MPVVRIATLILGNRENKQIIGTSYSPHHDWPVLHIQTGVMGFIRFPHEPVRVIRG